MAAITHILPANAIMVYCERRTTQRPDPSERDGVNNAQVRVGSLPSHCSSSLCSTGPTPTPRADDRRWPGAETTVALTVFRTSLVPLLDVFRPSAFATRDTSVPTVGGRFRSASPSSVFVAWFLSCLLRLLSRVCAADLRMAWIANHMTLIRAARGSGQSACNRRSWRKQVFSDQHRQTLECNRSAFGTG